MFTNPAYVWCSLAPSVREMAHRPPPHVSEYFAQFQLESAAAKLGTDWLGRMVSAMADVSALSVMSQLLKERGLHHSATDWKSVKERRLEPAIESQQLTRDDVRDMLRDMEEHGRMHVLLYRPREGFDHTPLLLKSRVANALSSMKLAKVLDAKESPDPPVNSAIVNVRFEDDVLVVKSLESKTIHRPVNEFILAGSRQIRLTQRVDIRRMRLARLHASGLLEVRLGAVRSGRGVARHSYVDEAETFLSSLGQLIPATWFEPASLARFKRNLWSRAKRGREPHIFVLGQTMASDRGNSMTLNAGNRSTDASQDEALRDASDAFLQREGSSLNKAVLLWRERGSTSSLGADVTVGVTHEINEFYTIGASSRADYEHVLSDIRRLGKL